MRDRSANRALGLGILSLPFGLLAPFAIWSGARSLGRIRASHGELRGGGAAAGGVIAGTLGLVTLMAGVAYWIIASSS